MPGRGQFLSPDLLCGFIAIHLRHLTIHQHGIVGSVGKGIHSLPPVPRHLYLTSKLLQKFARPNLIDLIVVYDKNPERCGAVRSAIEAIGIGVSGSSADPYPDFAYPRPGETIPR